jgi:integrase
MPGASTFFSPTDAKQWRLRYVIGGRESMLSLGTYPATSLKAARAKRTELRASLEAGKDPAGRAERDPTGDLRGALTPIKVTNRAAVTDPREVAQLLRALHGYHGHFIVEAALKIAPLVFVRPGELRASEWAEMDLNAGEWRIAAHRVKMRRPHLVPLAKQAVSILREIELLTGRGRFVFPSPRSAQRPLSDNAITAALRRIGYTGEQMSWHGFRAMASTLLNELGFPPDVIELQLAHQERNEVRAAYNRAQRR